MSDTRTKFMMNLQRIEEEHYQLREGEQLHDFVTLMLQYIGDPQPELLTRSLVARIPQTLVYLRL